VVAARVIFDKRAGDYDNETWHVRYASRLVSLAAAEPGMQVLDAATGTGHAAIAAARAVGPQGRVLGVDISGAMLTRARQSIAVSGLTNVAFILGDAAELPQLEDASFDLVLCSAGLLYLPVGPALREWARLVKPGGRVGFSTMREDFPAAGRLFREHAARFGLRLTDPAAPLGTPQRCRQALRDAAFDPAEIVAETVRFARADLERAWEAHVNGSYHDAVATLGPEQVRDFRAGYLGALAELLTAGEDDAAVLYAFGVRRSAAA
jgi:ubiquinone/menaquinone biosynthesis C-methylase UbiE